MLTVILNQANQHRLVLLCYMKQSVICDRNFLKICDTKYSETCLNLTSLGPDFMFGTDR
jgi:hypothetical protein